MFLPFADSFLAGALLTIILPLAVLIAVAVWYVLAIRRVPADTPVTSPTLPPEEVVKAAGPEVVSDVTPALDVTTDPDFTPGDTVDPARAEGLPAMPADPPGDGR